MPAAGNLSVFLRAIHKGGAGVACPVGVGSRRFLWQIAAASLEIEEGEGFLQDMVIGILRDDKGVGLAAVLRHDIVAARLRQGGKISDIIGLSGGSVLHSFVCRAA